MSATLYIDGLSYLNCELRAHTVDVCGETRLVPGVMRVTRNGISPQVIADGRVTVHYPFGPAETREATCHYAGGWLLADTKAARAVRP